ncbi:hypothetical protein CRUP_026533 [Coryphaenoides rupestris]|nr:hypothetical protein CRUP_026533 [Coryphaenoides rupestris]
MISEARCVGFWPIFLRLRMASRQLFLRFFLTVFTRSPSPASFMAASTIFCCSANRLSRFLRSAIFSFFCSSLTSESSEPAEEDINTINSDDRTTGNRTSSVQQMSPPAWKQKEREEKKGLPWLLFQWKQLENLYFREKKFAVEANGDQRTFGQAGLVIHTWYASHSLIKTIWGMAISQHQFYLDRKQSKSPANLAEEDINTIKLRRRGRRENRTSSKFKDALCPCLLSAASYRGDQAAVARAWIRRRFPGLTLDIFRIVAPRSPSAIFSFFCSSLTSESSEPAEEDINTINSDDRTTGNRTSSGSQDALCLCLSVCGILPPEIRLPLLAMIRSGSRVSTLDIFRIRGTEISVRSMAMSPELLVVD